MNVEIDFYTVQNIFFANVSVKDGYKLESLETNYNLKEAIAYQKVVKKSGYDNPFIVSFRDGEKMEF